MISTPFAAAGWRNSCSSSRGGLNHYHFRQRQHLIDKRIVAIGRFFHESLYRGLVELKTSFSIRVFVVRTLRLRMCVQEKARNVWSERN